MKNLILLKGLCVFFMLLSLLTSAFTLVSYAQSGHGGSTEVIARIEPQTEAPAVTEAATQPSQPQPVSADSQAILTGETFAWLAIIALFVSGTLVVLLRLKEQK